MNRTVDEAFALTDSDRALLIELLERERRELPTEIHHTDSPAYRQELRRRLDQVESLLLRLPA